MRKEKLIKVWRLTFFYFSIFINKRERSKWQAWRNLIFYFRRTNSNTTGSQRCYMRNEHLTQLTSLPFPGWLISWKLNTKYYTDECAALLIGGRSAAAATITTTRNFRFQEQRKSGYTTHGFSGKPIMYPNAACTTGKGGKQVDIQTDVQIQTGRQVHR